MEPAIPPVQIAGDEKKKIGGLGILLKLLSFFFPLLGFIIYFAQRKTNGYAARQALIFSVLGIVAAVFLNTMYHIIKSLL
jgi:hypothetical protein